MKKIQLAIKRERTVERHVGSSKWLVHIVLLICDITVNGTTPSAVADNIQTISDTMNGRKVNEFPSNKFVRQCRVVVQNLNYTLAALWLGDADEWHHIFTDGTSRRQTSFQNLAIAVMVDSNLNTVIIPSCMLLDDETSENQVKSIVNQIRYDVNMLRQSNSLSYSPSVHFYPFLATHIEAFIIAMERSHSQ